MMPSYKKHRITIYSQLSDLPITVVADTSPGLILAAYTALDKPLALCNLKDGDMHIISLSILKQSYAIIEPLE